ncbi:hypothetical protein ACNQFN_05235 [Thauera butanivorans]|uniref:hypothetical protein n=1 Tax=Thauera butanivorans TaxID=86174 RepID=UPI003AB2B74E
MPIAVDTRSVAALLLAAVLAAGGIGAFVASSGMRDEALARLSAAQRQHARLAAELDTLRQQQPELDAALEHWNALAALGVMQPPAPTAWAAQAARNLERQDIAGKELHFTPPRPVADGADPNAPRILVHSLEIDTPLQHEGRLPALVSTLAAVPGALVLPRNCTLSRVDLGTAGRVHAHCRFDWLTISLPSGTNTK